jgi:hypothetical protein
MRSVSRITGVSINTVSKLLIDAGLACAAFHDAMVRGVTAKAVQCDKSGAFHTPSKRLSSSSRLPPTLLWTWRAIDADSNLIVSWHVGDRSQHPALRFMGDSKARLTNRVQLTTGGHRAYLKAIKRSIGGHDRRAGSACGSRNLQKRLPKFQTKTLPKSGNIVPSSAAPHFASLHPG